MGTVAGVRVPLVDGRGASPRPPSILVLPPLPPSFPCLLTPAMLLALVASVCMCACWPGQYFIALGVGLAIITVHIAMAYRLVKGNFMADNTPHFFRSVRHQKHHHHHLYEISPYDPHNIADGSI